MTAPAPRREEVSGRTNYLITQREKIEEAAREPLLAEIVALSAQLAEAQDASAGMMEMHGHLIDALRERDVARAQLAAVEEERDRWRDEVTEVSERFSAIVYTAEKSVAALREPLGDYIGHLDMRIGGLRAEAESYRAQDELVMAMLKDARADLYESVGREVAALRVTP